MKHTAISFDLAVPAALQLRQSPLDKLRPLLANKADVQLIFDTPFESEDGRTNKIDVHSCLLRLHSSVLADAVDVNSGSAGRGCSSGAGGKRQDLALPGTAAEDFIKVLEFMYPVIPPPQVCWDNLEALLVQGHKWNMPYILHLAEQFIIGNAATMSINRPNTRHIPRSSCCPSRQYVFKWLNLVDSYNMQDACRACLDQIIAQGPAQCSNLDDELRGLSPQTLRCMIVRMAEHSRCK